MTETTLRASTRRPLLAGFAAFNALAAWAGAIALITGGADFGESINDRLPFDSPVLAGLALGIVVGIPSPCSPGRPGRVGREPTTWPSSPDSS